MSEIPLPKNSSSNEWIQSVAQVVDEDEQTLRAIVSSSSKRFQPENSEKEAALKDLVTDIYFKTSETQYDNSPQGRVWIQFPYKGKLGAHYEYYCDNPSHPAPDQMDVASGRNWTYVTHTVTKVDNQIRDVMQEIDHFHGDSEDAYPDSGYRSEYLDSEFGDEQITIVRGARHPDFKTTKRILTEGFDLALSNVYDAWGRFWSEWADSRVYWNE